MIFSVHIQSPDFDVVKRFGSLIQLLSGLVDLLFGALDLDGHSIRTIWLGNVDLGSGVSA